jgi:hypothetical protein
VLGSFVYSQTINSLKTDKEVTVFYKTHFKQLKELRLNAIFHSKMNVRYLDSIKAKAWYKEDFNNDGKTDLLVTGRFDTDHGPEDKAYVILSDSTNKYDLVDLILRDRRSIMPIVTIVKKGNESIIVLQQAVNYKFDNKYSHLIKVPIAYETYELSIQWLDSLVFKNGRLINYNSDEAKRGITRINYYSLPCFGTCPVFQFQVDSLGNAELNSIKYNSTLEGQYYTKLSPRSLQTLIWLINYLDIQKLDTNYSVGWTDDATAILEVQYESNTTKRIKDYGKTGTHGLVALYNFINNLRFTENWTKKNNR